MRKVKEIPYEMVFQEGDEELVKYLVDFAYWCYNVKHITKVMELKDTYSIIKQFLHPLDRLPDFKSRNGYLEQRLAKCFKQFNERVPRGDVLEQFERLLHLYGPNREKDIEKDVCQVLNKYEGADEIPFYVKWILPYYANPYDKPLYFSLSHFEFTSFTFIHRISPEILPEGSSDLVRYLDFMHDHEPEDVMKCFIDSIINKRLHVAQSYDDLPKLDKKFLTQRIKDDACDVYLYILLKDYIPSKDISPFDLEFTALHAFGKLHKGKCNEEYAQEWREMTHGVPYAYLLTHSEIGKKYDVSQHVYNVCESIERLNEIITKTFVAEDEKWRDKNGNTCAMLYAGKIRQMPPSCLMHDNSIRNKRGYNLSQILQQNKITVSTEPAEVRRYFFKCSRHQKNKEKFYGCELEDEGDVIMCNECVRKADPPPKQCYEYIYEFAGSRCNHCGVSRRNHIFFVYKPCHHAVCEKCYNLHKNVCPMNHAADIDSDLGYGSEIDDVVAGDYSKA